MDGEMIIEGSDGKSQGQIFILDQETSGELDGIKAMFYDGTPWQINAQEIKQTEITVPKAIKRRIKVYEQVTVADLAKATACRDKLLQASVGTKMVTAKKATVTFTGDLRTDFAAKEPLTFQKTNADRVEAAIAWDDTHLYLGWQVNDATPWVNGASEPAQMYAMGDTVDFQLGTDPAADAKRDKPVLGDLRLSIGYLGGKPTAVVYRPVAAEKAPKKFFSGVWRDGVEYDSVLTLADAKIEVKADAAKKRYVVEAAIPLAALGLKPASGLTLSGDFGATFGDAAGKDTVLRSHWNNQATGIVADEVAELQLEPKNWGRIILE